ncbi:hypothetical protein [Streptomyces sp. bgisy154]|uniref:hypothetical protein n=1 Tax=Streptomyces sp. bgisy154 TaxID=3413794 RepID=UPI003D74B3B1
MDDNDGGFLLLSSRERSTLEWDICRATSEAEVAGLLHRHDVSEDDFVKEFPDLAKLVQLLPDQGPGRQDSRPSHPESP